MRLVVFCTVRPGSHGLNVDRVVADLLACGAEHVVLGPLLPEEAADLAAQVAGVPVGPVLCEQVAGAGGNPLFVIELVRSLREDGVLDVAGGRAEIRMVSLPPTLRLTILRRLSRLPEDTLDVLRVAAILGSTFSVTELALVSGRGVAGLLPALRAAGDAGLLTDVGDRLTFRHVLVRDALYYDLPSAVRMGLHREAGVRLGAAGGSLERAATHVALGRRARRRRGGDVATTRRGKRDVTGAGDRGTPARAGTRDHRSQRSAARCRRLRAARAAGADRPSARRGGGGARSAGGCAGTAIGVGGPHRPGQRVGGQGALPRGDRAARAGGGRRDRA